MRKLLLITWIILLPISLFPQKLTNGVYWISLTNKEGSRFSVNNPSEFLSIRAIERRERQNILITSEDFPVSEAYTDSLKNLGLKILGTSKWFNSVIAESYDTLLLDTLSRISFISGFDYKIPRKKNFHEPRVIQEGNLQNAETGTGYDYGAALRQISIMNGNALHSAGYRGSNIQIAVIDGGFYKADVYVAFDSLRNEGRLLGYHDFTRTSEPFFATSSHGMSVLSTMAANIPGEIIGTAPKASYWLLKSEVVQSETPLEEAQWVMAAEFADSCGADIITSSLGYSQFDDPSLNYSYSDMNGETALCTRAAEKAFSKGMVVVVSAGNEGAKTWKHITAPSDGKNVLCVGAIDTVGKVASFSSRGPSSDFRTKPDVVAVGYRTMLINGLGEPGPGNGTSFAGPLIAGMVACLWQAAPEKSNSEIVSAIRQSASFYLSPNDSSGYGIPDFMLALSKLKASDPGVRGRMLTAVPNPNHGTFELRSESIPWGTCHIEISTASGEKIFAGNKNFIAGFTGINELNGLAAGIYLISAQSGGEKFFTKVVKLNP